MQIKIARIGVLDDTLPSSFEIDIDKEQTTVNEVMDVLDREYGGVKDELIWNRALSPGCRILLNGRSIDGYRGLKTVMRDGDRLLITILINGG